MFNIIHYLQKIGFAMGTKRVPKYANIFVGTFEKTYIYLYINLFLNSYCWFVHDIFFLWNGTVINLQEFIKELNNRRSTTNFDFKYSKMNIKFLGKTVYKNKEQNKLLVTVCYTDWRTSILHPCSVPWFFISFSKCFGRRSLIRKIHWRNSNGFLMVLLVIF